MWKKGRLEITDEYEDIHSFVEANTDRPDRRCRKEAAYRTQP